MKKFFSVLISLILIGSLYTPFCLADVQEEFYPTNAPKLSIFGIEPANTGEEEVTREDFARALLKFINQAPVASPQIFPDVDIDYPTADVINTCASLGYLTGYRDKCFYPESPIYYTQAVKALLCAMGYYGDATKNGGYQEGYTKTALRIGLTKNCTGDTLLTWSDLTRLLLNASEINPLEMDMSEQTTTYEETDGDCLWVYHRIKKLDDVVNANDITGLYSKDEACSEDCVMLGDEEVSVGDTDADDYLGAGVCAYVKYSDDLEGEIVYISYSTKNAENEISSKDILTEDPAFSYTTLVYEASSGSRKTVSIDENVAIIYNGIAMPLYSSETLSPSVGTVTLVDNDGNGKYDVIKVFEANRIIVVDSIINNNDGITVVDKYDMSKRYTYRDNYEKYAFISDDGINASNITKGMFLLIGENGEHAITIASDESNTGKVVSKTSDEVCIDSTTLTIPTVLDTTELRVGKTVDYWTWNGFILEYNVANENGMYYGYFIRGYEYYGDDGSYVFELKILTSDDETKNFKTTEHTAFNDKHYDKFDAGKLFKQTTPAAKAREAYPSIPQCNEDVDGDGWIEQVIMYSLDDDGNLKKVYTQASDGELRYEGLYCSDWYDNSYTLYQDTWQNLFYQDDDTVTFYISTSNLEDSYARGKITWEPVITDDYVHEFYNVDDDYHTVDVVVWRKDLSTGEKQEPIKDEMYPTVITNVVRTLNEDDVAVNKLIGNQAGAIVELEYNDKLSDAIAAVFDSVAKGDIVYYKKNAAGRLTNIVVSYRANKAGEYGIATFNDYDYVHGNWNNGMHIERKCAYIQVYEKLTNNFITYFDGEGRKCIQKIDASAKFYKVIDSPNRFSVEEITYNDVQPGDDIYASYRYNKLQEMIVIEND